MLADSHVHPDEALSACGPPRQCGTV